MGCFMTSCAVTGRTIQHYDPVVAFVVTDVEQYHSSEPREMFLIHPWDRVTLISMPIFGQYDDYGSIEPDDSNAIALEHLQSIFPNTTIIEDDAIAHDFLREKVTAYDSKEYQVGLMMIHRDTYDYLMTKHKHDGRKHLDVVLDEFMRKEEDDYHSRIRFHNILSFCSDHDIVYKYGKDDPEDYYAPNLLRALNIMDAMGPMHKLARHLSFKSKVKDKIPDNYYEQFELWTQTQALMDAFDTLGIEVAPSLHMGQDNNLEAIIDLNIDNISNLLDRIGKDEIEYGLFYDHRTKTEWSNIDKYQTILDDFHKKMTAKLAEHKANCVYEDEDD